MTPAAPTTATAPTGTSRLLADAVGVDLGRHLETHGRNPVRGKVKRGHAGPLVSSVEQSGLAGRGGGWFPTGRKMHAVVSAARTGRKDPVVVVNAMEGEPAASKDAVLVSRNPHLVLDGAVLAAQSDRRLRRPTCAAHRGGRSLRNPREGSRSPSAASPTDPVELRLDRRARPLRRERGERPGPPRRRRHRRSPSRRRRACSSPAYGSRPHAAVQRRDLRAPRAHRPARRRTGSAPSATPTVPGTTLVTVGGAVASPGVLEVPTGTTVRQILGLAGGTTGSVNAAVTGGYGGVVGVGGRAVVDLPWTPKGLAAPPAASPVPASSSCFAEDACGLVETARVVRWMASSERRSVRTVPVRPRRDLGRPRPAGGHPQAQGLERCARSAACGWAIDPPGVVRAATPTVSPGSPPVRPGPCSTTRWRATCPGTVRRRTAYRRCSPSLSGDGLAARGTTR